MFGERLRQTRVAAGLTLRELADRVGSLTAAAISKLENDKALPRQSTILSLARALNITTSYLLEPPKVNLTLVEFRKKASLPESQSERAQAQVKNDLEGYIDLVQLLTTTGIPQYESPFTTAELVENLDDVEDRAEALRDEWRLGLDPIRNVIEMIEDHGIRVLTLDIDDRIDELAVIANNKYPALVIKNLEKGKGDRQRFNALHGLGHLLLCHGPGVDKEKMCHRFAGAVLAPRDTVFRKLGKKRSTLDLSWELPMLKREFGMSIHAWIRRAQDLKIITPEAAQRLFAELSRRGQKINEPIPIPLETPSLYQMMVHRALAEDIITPVQAATYLGVSPERARRQRAEVKAELVVDEDDLWVEIEEEDFIDA